MSARDRDEQAWRMTFARLLLCAMMIYYLATLTIIALARPNLHSVRALSQIVTLFLLSTFATIALGRLRGASILAIAVAALMSLWILFQTMLQIPLLDALSAGISQWRTGVAVLMTLVINSLPTVAFFVVWPMRSAPFITLPGRADSTDES